MRAYLIEDHENYTVYADGYRSRAEADAAAATLNAALNAKMDLIRDPGERALHGPMVAYEVIEVDDDTAGLWTCDHFVGVTGYRRADGYNGCLHTEEPGGMHAGAMRISVDEAREHPVRPYRRRGAFYHPSGTSAY